MRAGDTSVIAEPSPTWHPEVLPPTPVHTRHRDKHVRPETTTANAGGAALGFGAVHAQTCFSLDHEGNVVPILLTPVEGSPSVTLPPLPLRTLLPNGGQTIYA